MLLTPRNAECPVEPAAAPAPACTVPRTVPRSKIPAFRFSRMESLRRGPLVQTVLVDGAHAEFVTDPALVRRMLLSDSRSYGKGELFRKARNLSRLGLLAEDESVHRHYRRLAHPHLRAATAAEYAPDMRAITRGVLASWRPGQAVNIQDEMCRIAGSIAVRTLFRGPSAELASVLGERLAALSWEMIRKPLHGKAASPTGRQTASQRLPRLREEVRGLLAPYVAGEPNSPDAGGGYLSALLADSGRPGSRALTTDQVCDEAVMMLTAATVTTASVMSWALYVLSQEPQVEENLLKDLAQRPEEFGPPARGNGSVGYTLRFLMEVLRLYPPVWITCRRTLSRVELGDRVLAEGTQVLFSSYLLHRDPGSYPEPHRFLPDRWLSGRPPADGVYLPFGAGAKGCIGESFAWTELEILLGTVVRDWRLTVDSGSRVRKAADTTLHPRRLFMVPQAR
jgi:cytochrome P450